MPRRRKIQKPPNIPGFLRDVVDDVFREWGIDTDEDPRAEFIFNELRKKRPRLGVWGDRIKKAIEERR